MFQEALPFDLLVEFYEDIYEDSPHEMLDAMRGEDGEIMLDDTGDPLIDKWERELAKGLQPDFEEGMSDEAKKKLAAEREKMPKVKQRAAEALMDERFDMPPAQPKANDPRYASKFVQRGSAEERALLGTRAVGEKQDNKRPRFLGDEVRRGR